MSHNLLVLINPGNYDEIINQIIICKGLCLFLSFIRIIKVLDPTPEQIKFNEDHHVKKIP